VERRTKDDWANLVASWKSSGMTAAEFGEARDVNPRTLIYWQWRLKKEGRTRPRRAKQTVEKLTFTELALSAVPAAIELVVGEVTVRVPSGASMDQLRSVLEVVRGAR
jgi:hypothetical protein